MTSSRDQLIAWLRACTTGTDKLRAGVPADWKVGDKTGSGAHGETSDVAIFWPPHRKPILVTAYYADSLQAQARRNAVLAEVGGVVASLVAALTR